MASSASVRRAAAALVAAALGTLLTAAPARAAVWSLDDHPSPPPGAPFKVPLGPPGDLQFLAPNAGLLSVEGNSTVARGLYFYDGRSWRPLSTVCGGTGETARIAWAGPSEFWTITEPSLPRQGTATALCRFKDGEVAASYSMPEQSSDVYRRMNAASCASPTACWFAGARAADPSGAREGAFHLRWDGRGLEVLYNRDGRGVSDVQAFGDRFLETSVVGAQVDSRETGGARPVTGESRPRLLHQIAGRAFSRDQFVPRDLPDPDPDDAEAPPPDTTDLLALDATGALAWAVGGGTTSGALPADPNGPTGAAMYDRPPIAVVQEGGRWRELDLAPVFAPGERFVDVAAIPGTDEAWVAVQRFADRRTPSARGRVVRIAADGTVLESVTLPTSGSGRGAIARIDCPSATDCWAVTTAGWVLHLTDGAAQPLNTDPAFANLITFRPNESVGQFIPDAPPTDDSGLFAPPVLEVEQTPPPAPAAAAPKKLAALLKNVRSKLRGRRRLVITFRLARRARIGVVGRRGTRVVARFRARTFTPGRRSITLKLNPRRYPKTVRFSVRELDLPQSTAGPDDTGAGTGDTVTTGGAG